MLDVLNIVNAEMQALGIPYEFERWTAETIEYPYFVGEYIESPAEDESGKNETEFILTGTTRGTWLELEQMRDKIETSFHPVEGKRYMTEKAGIAIFYANAFPVPTETEDLKRIQINLDIKKWKV